jgi:ABC-2 type transport system permease protein
MAGISNSVPDSMKVWFGDAQTWQSYAGFSAQEIFLQMTILPIIMAIVFGVAFLAGDEENRIMLTTLARPIKRESYYLQKYLALVIFIVLVMTGFGISAVLGGVMLGEKVDVMGFVNCTAMTTLLVLTLGTWAFAIGAITGRKNFGGIIVGFYAFVAYFIMSLSESAKIIEQLNYGSLFRYLDASTVMANGLEIRHVVVFLFAIAVPLIVALPIFIRRDLSTR